MDSRSRCDRDRFLAKVRNEWNMMWSERFYDRFRAEAIVVKDYPLLFVDRGCVIFANRDAKAPSWSEILGAWGTQGMVHSPHPSVGGWGKFIRTQLKDKVHSRAKSYKESSRSREELAQQLPKGGRGWLHKT